MYERLPLQQSVRLVLDEKPYEVPPQYVAEVERAWEKACSEKKELFSGPVFIVSHVTDAAICGTFAEYKHLLSQKLLNIKPLGVSGVVRSGGKVLVGKRATTLFSHPGYYELVPSGTVDRLFFWDVLFQELKEESSLTQSDILSHHILGLFYDPESMVYDIAVLLES